MSDLDTLKQQVTEMQAEIERLEAKESEPEIPVGTLCVFSDSEGDAERVGILCARKGEYSDLFPFTAKAGVNWKRARIANDIPGVMVWQKHDGGPCPVDSNTRVIAMPLEGFVGEFIAGNDDAWMWDHIKAYAIINKAEWME